MSDDLDTKKRKRLLEGVKKLCHEIPLESEELRTYLVDFLYGGIRYAVGAEEARAMIERLMDESEARRNQGPIQ